MAGFSVDTDALRTFGGQVSQLCADLSDAILPSDLSVAEAGNAEVADALEEFHAHWKQQQGKLLSSLQALGKAINDAADGYQQSDAAISAGASGESP